jgi:hypothetical protein
MTVASAESHALLNTDILCGGVWAWWIVNEVYDDGRFRTVTFLR